MAWTDGRKRDVEITSDTAVWFSSGRPAVPIRWVLIRDPAGHFETQALLSTKPELEAVQILAWFLHRWQVEVTFQEARAHLGLETQRQWSPLAIARTTPLLLGLFSWIVLAAHALYPTGDIPIRTAAWYHKSDPTFSDLIAAVRIRLWPVVSFLGSPSDTDTRKLPLPLYNALITSLAYAA